MSNTIKVFINKIDSGSLSLEDEQYIFNYKEFAKDVVSLTMPIRNASWHSKNFILYFK